ncbi:MAG: tryptophan 7-halogenase, partial [Alphaproteobacteria bacterium]
NRQLVTFWPNTDFSPVLADAYNRVTERLQEEVRDFIVLHYRLNNRQDPYWVAARRDLPIPDSLAADFERWRHTLPNEGDHAEAQLFPATSNLMCLFGKGFYDVDSPPEARPETTSVRELNLEGFASPLDWSRFSEFVLAQKKKLVADLPDHRALVASIRGDAGAAPDLAEAAML